MFTVESLADLIPLRESAEVECKLAAGKDGNGALPKDFWPTYSAMANTHGGIVLLGLREKVSINLLADGDVSSLVVDGKTLLKIRIPAASRKQKPIFLNGQPLGNTWRRLHEGDRRCDDDTVKRMLAEQLEDSRDTRVLNSFGLQDIDMESLHAYRNAFAAHRPDHPWVQVDDLEFLRLIGGWREDRNNGEKGLTLAGVLMFGQWPSITEAAPLYFLDYQERSADNASETRWLDRVVPDGTWSGNLYDFYRKVIRKLTADLKIPFVLKGDVRVEDTPVHQALREALVNTLIHADYSDRASVLVIKQPSGFVFRNPGVMRLPIEIALQGGASDCRNRTMHQIFLFINLGERAGSGIPKIRAGWTAAGHAFRLFDSIEPYDHTLLEMDWADGVSPAEEKTLTPPATPEKTPEKTPERILDALQKNKTATISDLAALLEKSESAIERALRKLKKSGRLRRIGADKGGYWEVLK